MVYRILNLENDMERVDQIKYFNDFFAFNSNFQTFWISIVLIKISCKTNKLKLYTKKSSHSKIDLTFFR